LADTTATIEKVKVINTICVDLPSQGEIQLRAQIPVGE
jgi:hypothetical protein